MILMYKGIKIDSGGYLFLFRKSLWIEQKCLHSNFHKYCGHHYPLFSDPWKENYRDSNDIDKTAHHLMIYNDRQITTHDFTDERKENGKM